MEKKHLCFILLVTVLIFSSCSTTSVHLKVLTPAEINVPANLRKVIVANRSLPERSENSLNILEGFLTGESILADHEGSKYCIAALVDELNDNPRYEAILKDDNELAGTGTRQFPEPLNMNKVKEICSQYRADGLILLETFDSNIDLVNGTEQVKKKVDNREITVTEYICDLHINVNAGWRIYDPVNSKIIDQNQFMDEKSWSGRGDSKKSALKALPSKRGAINESGAYAGMRYGKRISPNWKWISRNYYIRKHSSFKVARNHVKKDQWDKAAELWNAMTRDQDPKTAGRACYNMALANEMEGHLDVALNWAQKAYDQYHIKAAKSYSRQLKSRLDQQKSLNEQMEGVE